MAHSAEGDIPIGTLPDELSTPDRYHAALVKCCGVPDHADLTKYKHILREKNLFLYDADPAEETYLINAFLQSRKIIVLFSADQCSVTKDILKLLRSKYRSRGSSSILAVVQNQQHVDKISEEMWVEELKPIIVIDTGRNFDKSLVADLQKAMRYDMKDAHNAGMGAASALGYYCGYLRIIYQDFQKRIEKYPSFKKEPSERNMPKTFYIVLPESCKCLPSMKDLLVDNVEEMSRKVKYQATVAGHHDRDYSHPVYKIINHSGPDYYCCIEFATPLATMYQVADIHKTCMTLCELTEGELLLQMQLFYFTLKETLSHPDYAMFELIYYADRDLSQQQNMHDVLCCQIQQSIRNDLECEKETERLKPRVQTPGEAMGLLRFEGDPSKYQENPDMEYVDVKRNHQGFTGRCLIISNENFSADSGFEKREGTQIDHNILQKLFKDFLKFEVELCIDLTIEEMKEKFKEYSQMDFVDWSLFACVILTHGQRGVLYGTDGQDIAVVTIADYFSTPNCPTMQDIPRLFFVQACQQYPDEYEEPNLTDYKDHRLVPEHPNMFMNYSSLPGSRSYRHLHNGSFYVNAINQVFREKSVDHDIDRLMKMVTEKVKEDTAKEDPGLKQCPFHLHTVTKLLKFYTSCQ